MCSPIVATWKPDPRPYRVTTMDFKEVLGRKDMKVIFHQNNNTMVLRAAVSITLSCSMIFTSFPFDKQRCKLELELPGNITPKLLSVNLTDTDTLGYNMQVSVRY